VKAKFSNWSEQDHNATFSDWGLLIDSRPARVAVRTGWTIACGLKHCVLQWMRAGR